MPYVNLNTGAIEDGARRDTLETGLRKIDRMLRETFDTTDRIDSNVGALTIQVAGIVSGAPATPDTLPPIITSSSTASIPENSAFSLVLSASEVVTWSKVGGADEALFTLSGSTLSLPAQNYEAPADADTNNVYVVQVRATDAAGNFSLQTISVTVTDVAEGGDTPPVITSSASQSVNNTDPYTLVLTANEAVTWSIIGGLDAALFDIGTSTTGAIGFNPDLPTDNGTNNVYELTIRATSVATGLTTDQNLTITVSKPAATGNLINKPDELDATGTGNWTRGNCLITPNAAVAVSGDTTAELIYPAPTATQYITVFQQNVAGIVSGTTYELSFEVKPSGKTKCIIGLGQNFGYVDVWYDITGLMTGTGSGVTPSITALTNGWYRVKWRKAAAASGNTTVNFYVADTMASYAVTPNGSDGIFVANAQLVAV